MVTAGLSLENPVFKAFLFYAGIVLIKTILMSPLTAFYRVTRKAFVTVEDAIFFTKDKKNYKVDPVVETVRSAQLNDLENIIPFTLLGLLYSTIDPNLYLAILHFQMFTIARILYTIFYLFSAPSPSRAVVFSVGVCVNLSLAVQVIWQGTV